MRPILARLQRRGVQGRGGGHEKSPGGTRPICRSKRRRRRANRARLVRPLARRGGRGRFSRRRALGGTPRLTLEAAIALHLTHRCLRFLVSSEFPLGRFSCADTAGKHNSVLSTPRGRLSVRFGFHLFPRHRGDAALESPMLEVTLLEFARRYKSRNPVLLRVSPGITCNLWGPGFKWIRLKACQGGPGRGKFKAQKKRPCANTA